MINVVLCGGAGARLWPLSRELYPKPFIRFGDGESFLRKAFIRGAHMPQAEGFLVIANREFYFKAAEEYAALHLKLKASFILEPFGRNTGPAIAAAALKACRDSGEETPILVLPSDHLISNQEAFAALVSRGREFADAGRLVTFGITPTAPKTGFGYIEADRERVVRFVEKPSLEKATEYVESGRFLWNSGIFCFRAGVMLAELGRHAPELLRKVEATLAASAVNANGALELDEAAFAQVPDISIDYAVFEKSDKVAVVGCDSIGWNDIGTWTEYCGFAEEVAGGNRVTHPRQALLHDASNCDVNNYNRLVAVLGLENVLIVDTEDALLVADKSRAQDVRAVYERLKQVDHETYRRHRTVHRPWGYYTILEEGERFKAKRLGIRPGAKISLQLHHHRSEHWIVVSGMAEVACEGKTFFLNSNESTYIKAGQMHRVANPGKVDLILIGVQSGDYLGEDDIIRFEDSYGRV
ncbi:MAG: mannose-1-phosphate guanylyltransferase/mannose-6-phosphate isomerase [Planctomycetes bacterium]|nr:mannose-1-phosphate guanylyltransferase/mannose-6-phosphate isomerase [Planctomycetota bacterium]